MAQAPATIYPVLRYQDAPAAIDWLQAAFGFEPLLVAPNPDGSIAFAEMRFGAGVIMLGSARDEHGWRSPRDLPGLNQTLYVSIEDPDAHCERARAAGALITRELEITDYGSREYSASDIEGHHWSFGTYRPEAG